jgi:hypothetical protein
VKLDSRITGSLAPPINTGALTLPGEIVYDNVAGTIKYRDSVNSVDKSLAPLASPSFTGTINSAGLIAAKGGVDVQTALTGPAYLGQTSRGAAGAVKQARKHRCE